MSMDRARYGGASGGREPAGGGFLWEQPPLHRDVFVLRYYHFSSIQRIAKAYAIGESKTKSILFRTRKKLRVFLESEGLL